MCACVCNTQCIHLPQALIEIFNNVLADSNAEGWEQLQMVSSYAHHSHS